MAISAVDLGSRLRSNKGRLLSEIRKRTAPNAPSNIRMPIGPLDLPESKRKGLMNYLEGISRLTGK
jgi:hypothetical protein